ncbi:unnamed protein product, partial [Larinioides sclopetarius]
LLKYIRNIPGLLYQSGFIGIQRAVTGNLKTHPCTDPKMVSGLLNHLSTEGIYP